MGDFMLIDTHLHLGEDFGIPPDLLIEHARCQKVQALIASFCEKDDISFSTFYTEKYDCVYAAVGYHPEVADKIVDSDFEILEKLISENPKIVAIGEIGLDYYWNKENQEQQRKVFRRQLALAEKLNLPVIIHSRDAIGETYEILKDYSVKGVIHCLEMAQKFIDIGFLLGIGGVLTFRNSKLYQVIEKISLSSIVLETDSPYLAPEPVRGKTNESSNLIYIAEKLAEIKQLSLESVAFETTQNAINLFDLPIKI